MKTPSTTTFALTITTVAILAAGCQNGGDTATASPASSPSAASASPGNAGNGMATLSADEILERTEATLHQAKSFHVKAKAMSGTVITSVEMKVSGTDVAGSVSVGAAKTSLLRVGSQQYFHPNERFWVMAGTGKQAHRIARLVGDRWIRVPASNKQLSKLFDDANVDNLIELDGQLSKGAAKQIAGVPTIGLTDGAATLYVATTGKPYPVRQEGTDGSEMTFSEIDATFSDIKTPAAGQIVDLADLTGK